jgi:hypothetical protein
MESDIQKITITEKSTDVKEKSRISIIVGVFTVTRHVTMECANSLIECTAAAKDRGYGFNCIFYKAATLSDAKNALFNTAIRASARKNNEHTHFLLVSGDVSFAFKDVERLIAEDQPLICALPPISKNWRNIAAVAKSGKLTIENIQSVLTGYDFTYVPTKLGLPKSGIIETPYCELAFALFNFGKLAAFMESRDVASSVIRIDDQDTYDVFGTRLVSYKDGSKAMAIGDKLFCTMWNTAMGSIFVNTHCRVGRHLEEYVVGALDKTINDSLALTEEPGKVVERTLMSVRTSPNVDIPEGKQEVDDNHRPVQRTRFNDAANETVVKPRDGAKKSTPKVHAKKRGGYRS